VSEPAYLAALPKKRMAVGVLFVNARDELLIVKPTYRPEWLIPGGSVEANESPYRAGVREVYEELGLVLPLGRLLCVDYQSAEPQKSESIQFIFEGGLLSDEVIDRIVLPAGELATYTFTSLPQALNQLTPHLGRRLVLAIAARAHQQTIYAEDGVEVGGSSI
jgi:8-oxo-dGTP diphosphatase